MTAPEEKSIWRRAFGRGVFPHQMTWFLDLPGRGLIMSARKVARRLPVPADARVLEIGPGSGYYTVELARKVPRGELVLLDLQEEMLRKAQDRLRRAGRTNFRTQQGDGKSLPFDDDSFDAIAMVTVFGEIEEQAAFLEEAARVLGPGGVLSITEHHPDPDFEPYERVAQAVSAAGFLPNPRLGWRWAYTCNAALPDHESRPKRDGPPP